MFYRVNGAEPKLLGSSHFIADNARVIGDVELHNQSSVWYNAVIRGDNDRVTVGRCSNIQDGCVLHTDPGIPLVIEPEVTVGHLVMLHGCRIGQGSLIGIHTTILNGASIGKHCIVGANTLIPEGKMYPDNVLILGSPGRVVRELNEEEVERLSLYHQVYTNKISMYENLEKVDLDA